MFELGHTLYNWKQKFKLAIASLATSIVFATNYMSIGSQNGPTLHEHASQGFHVIMGEVQPSLVYLPTFVEGNYLPN